MEAGEVTNTGTIKKIRTFESGATRDSEDGKLDPEGALSELVVLRYSQYMAEHRTMADGSLRDTDNWKAGFTPSSYVKSLWRHILDLWLIHRGFGDWARHSLEDCLCAIIFNASGYLHRLMVERYEKER